MALTALAVDVGMDFADQEAILVKLCVGLLGHADQRVATAVDSLHGVGGRVSAALGQLREGLAQLLLVSAEDRNIKRLKWEFWAKHLLDEDMQICKFV